LSAEGFGKDPRRIEQTPGVSLLGGIRLVFAPRQSSVRLQALSRQSHRQAAHAPQNFAQHFDLSQIT
jgi:hypothetical protein